MPVLTRRELHDLVWSKPVPRVAAEFSISDVALANRPAGPHGWSTWCSRAPRPVLSSPRFLIAKPPWAPGASPSP